MTKQKIINARRTKTLNVAHQNCRVRNCGENLLTSTSPNTRTGMSWITAVKTRNIAIQAASDTLDAAIQ